MPEGKQPNVAESSQARLLVRRLFRGGRGWLARRRMGGSIEPLSYQWGHDRGQEIARYYIEQHFLPEFRDSLRGRVLEFEEPVYAPGYGGDRVTKIDIINLEEGIPGTTIRADLTQEDNGLAPDLFDCIICTHVLHIIPEFQKAVAGMYRILKPGGALLVAVPQVSMCDPGWGELWRFTEQGLRRALEHSFQPDRITTRAYGNSLTSAGEIRGLVADEFSHAELNTHDTRFAVEVCACAVK